MKKIAIVGVGNFNTPFTQAKIDDTQRFDYKPVEIEPISVFQAPMTRAERRKLQRKNKNLNGNNPKNS